MNIISKIDATSNKYLIYKEIRLSSTKCNRNVDIVQLVLHKKKEFISSISTYDSKTSTLVRKVSRTNVVNIIITSKLLRSQINQFIPELRLQAFHLKDHVADVSKNGDVWIVPTAFNELHKKWRQDQVNKRLNELKKRLQQ